MKIYTRTGDGGRTALFGGGRVPKDHPRVCAYGEVDELNAFLGRALGTLEVPQSRERLEQVQHDLFALGSHLATPPARDGRRRPELPPLPEARIAEMEAWMDEAEEALPPLRDFILPGGGPGAGELHVCRTVCRRAERAVLALVDARDGVRSRAVGTSTEPQDASEAPGNPSEAGREPAETRDSSEVEEPGAEEPGVAMAIRYLNRLSDLLFVLARLENVRAGRGDRVWRKEEEGE